MVAIYVRWIKDGKISLNDVPTKWRQKVQAKLKADGWTE